MVVFHLHGQTSRSKAWANGTQNSRPWWISSRNHVYHLYKSDPFTGKRPRRPETGIKVDFEEMEHSFPFGIFRPEKQDYLFRCFVAPANFPLERSKKSCSIHFPTGFPGQFWWMVNNPFLLTLLENFHTFILQLLCSHWSVTLFFPNVALLWSNETTVIPKSPLRNDTRVFYFLLVL